MKLRNKTKTQFSSVSIEHGKFTELNKKNYFLIAVIIESTGEV